MNVVTVTGEVYREPMRFTAKNGLREETPIWTFNLRADPNYFDDKNERPPIVRIKCYGSKWARLQYRFRQGVKLFVKGKLQTVYSRKEKDGVVTIEFVSYIFAENIEILNDYYSKGNQEQSDMADKLDELDRLEVPDEVRKSDA